jgi:hypothetical protein
MQVFKVKALNGLMLYHNALTQYTILKYLCSALGARVCTVPATVNLFTFAMWLKQQLLLSLLLLFACCVLMV